jgi:opacity protein-like surface antigen
MSHIYQKLVFATIIGFCSQTTFADGAYMSHIKTTSTPPTFMSFLKTHFVATLSGGPSWPSGDFNNQTLDLAPGITRTYAGNTAHGTFGIGDLFLGVQYPLTKGLQGQIGLDVNATGNVDMSGTVWDDADPTFANHAYTYLIRHTGLLIKGKLIATDWDWPVLPWISAGIGMGFNQTSQFSNTPIIFEALPAPNFGGTTNTSFSWTIGIGVQHEFTPHWQLGAGYELMDWGQSQLTTSPEQTTGVVLIQKHIYSSSLMFNLTFLA